MENISGKRRKLIIELFTKIRKNKPGFFKWAYFNIRTIVVVIFVLFLTIPFIQYTFLGFILNFVSYLAGYTTVLFGIYYWKFILKDKEK